MLNQIFIVDTIWTIMNDKRLNSKRLEPSLQISCEKQDFHFNANTIIFRRNIR